LFPPHGPYIFDEKYAYLRRGVTTVQITAGTILGLSWDLSSLSTSTSAISQPAEKGSLTFHGLLTSKELPILSAGYRRDLSTF
jgi:hypothetical protein